MNTIQGTDLPESITGGAGDDQINAKAGNDTIHAGAGNDIIFADAGDDQVYGEDGADTIEGGTGSDLLDGGAGDDRITAGDGDDTVHGGLGNDRIVFSSTTVANTRTTAFGGDGDDAFVVDGIQQSGSSYEATGGAGSDRYLVGLSAASFTITDFSGSDGDVLDLLAVMPADLAINPFASGFLRAEEINGATVISMDYDGPGLLEHQWQTLVTLKGVTLAQIPVRSITGGFDVTGSVTGMTLSGTVADDNLAGEYLNDTISGGAGNDRIDGSGGNDQITGGDEEAGGDVLLGGNGNDVLLGGAGDDSLDGGRHDDLLQGGLGKDSLDGGLGDDTLYGGEGDDKLYDAWGRNQMYSGAGDDRLNSADDAGSLVDGGDGSDFLVLGGLDTAYGGAGDDEFRFSGGTILQAGQAVTVDGGDGNDQMHFGLGDAYRITARGGLGVDTYHFAYHGGAEPIEILDFAPGAGGDVLDIATIQALDWQSRGVNPFGSDGILRAVQDGVNTLLQFDVDGAAGSTHAWRTIATLRNLDARLLDASNMTGGFNFDGSFAHINATGTVQSDNLAGTAWNDTLEGLAGNDRLAGGGGNDMLKGGDGTDFAVFSGDRSEYVVGHDGSGVRFVTHQGQDGADTLVGMERIVFNDRVIALDLDGAGGQVYRLYQAAFNRTPDLPGVGFWIGIADGGMPLVRIAQDFMTSPEFAHLYGGAPNNEALVRLFYVNALHREPDEPGVTFWTGVLDSGSATAAEVLAGFSESPENIGAVAQVIGNGFEYVPYP